jgi:hypothetical protein
VSPLGSLAAVAIATVTALASGWAIVAMSGTSTQQDAAPSIGIERNDERAGAAGAKADSGGALASNPNESSFGTLQEDGTYCGVTCWETH